MNDKKTLRFLWIKFEIFLYVIEKINTELHTCLHAGYVYTKCLNGFLVARNRLFSNVECRNHTFSYQLFDWEWTPEWRVTKNIGEYLIEMDFESYVSFESHYIMNTLKHQNFTKYVNYKTMFYFTISLSFSRYPLAKQARD